MNHSEDCRQRIEERMRVDDPERYVKTLGRFADGTLKEGRGREIDERKMGDMEVKKKLQQKEDRKEERREDIRKKADKKKEDVSQGECMDTKRTWICPKCKTENAES